MGVVYQFLFPNGKVYIGQTTKKDVRKRWHQHRVRSNHSWLVARAIKKYGWDNVHKTVLAELPNSLLDEYETKFIDLYSSLKPGGYNLTPGGDANPMDLEDVRAKHAAAVQSDDHRRAQSNHTKKWRKNTDKHEAWRKANAAAQRLPSARKKRSGISKASWTNASIRKKRVDGLNRAFSNPEVSQKRKTAAAKALKTPEFSAKMSAAFERRREAKLALLPPEEREKKAKDMEKRRGKAREKYRLAHGYYEPDLH